MCLQLQHSSSLGEIYVLSHSSAVTPGEPIVSCYSCMTSWYAGNVRCEAVGNAV